MGEVYKAEDLKLDQTVALKFLPEKLAKNEDALKRFVGEVRNARQVSHENVCRVFDIGEINGQHFISMEFVDGDDLSQLLRRIGRLLSDKAIEISRQICLGLNAIHKAGILHRDLKPANIIIDSNGKAQITDFGIAGIEQEIQTKKEIVGTPAYMSPEQITGEEVTAKSDIYSLGLLLYEIFTGKQAVKGESINDLIKKLFNGTIYNFADGRFYICPSTNSDGIGNSAGRSCDEYYGKYSAGNGFAATYLPADCPAAYKAGDNLDKIEKLKALLLIIQATAGDDVPIAKSIKTRQCSAKKRQRTRTDFAARRRSYCSKIAAYLSENSKFL